MKCKSQFCSRGCIIFLVLFLGISLPHGGTTDVGSSLGWRTTNESWNWWISPFSTVSIWGHSAVWTGQEMIVWGGFSLAPPAQEVDTGGRFDPSATTWVPTSTTGAPTARQGHSAVWTGSLMIVWGGSDVNGDVVASGGVYDPATDSWVETSTTGAPEARGWHTAVWTGTEMIVWGGAADSMSLPLATGGRYNPADDEWSDVSTVDAPIGRVGHSAVWTGDEMIVWGGDRTVGLPPYQTSTGGRYDPSTDAWTDVSETDVPDARSSHAAVWTGDTMIVWGGQAYGPGILNTGGRYDPSTDEWAATDTITAPEPTVFSQAVWTGAEMIVWGGSRSSGSYSNSGGHYDPVADLWHPTALEPAPEPRRWNTSIWTGRAMIIWGGQETTPSDPLELAVYSNQPIFADGFESGDTSAWSTTTVQP